jgi:CheY-like chemotaxis protein/HPt (histidine-containing phosphotransfer) domain-containing protein
MAAPVNEATGGSARGARVLLVEDDQTNQEVEALMLEDLGYEVDRVSDGAAAVTAAAAATYSAIVMDCQLPAMDGYATTAAIRASEPAERRVRIIGLSAHADVRRCHEAGMDELLSKPVTLAGLAQALQDVPAHAADAVDSVLDPDVVGQLRSLAQAGNPELLFKLQASFARDTPQRLRELRSAVAAGDAGAVAFTVHTLKGSAANLGAREVVDSCAAIEDACAAAGLGSLEPMLAGLEQRAALAQAALSRLAETG